MGKNYEDLSRRGLIKLDHDFDKQNNGALSKYLAKHEDEYEDIRPVEKVIDCCDTAVASIKRSISCVKASMKEDAELLMAEWWADYYAEDIERICDGNKESVE